MVHFRGGTTTRPVRRRGGYRGGGREGRGAARLKSTRVRAMTALGGVLLRRFVALRRLLSRGVARSPIYEACREGLRSRGPQETRQEVDGGELVRREHGFFASPISSYTSYVTIKRGASGIIWSKRVRGGGGPRLARLQLLLGPDLDRLHTRHPPEGEDVLREGALHGQAADPDRRVRHLWRLFCCARTRMQKLFFGGGGVSAARGCGGIGGSKRATGVRYLAGWAQRRGLEGVHCSCCARRTLVALLDVGPEHSPMTDSGPALRQGKRGLENALPTVLTRIPTRRTPQTGVRLLSRTRTGRLGQESCRLD